MLSTMLWREGETYRDYTYPQDSGQSNAEPLISSTKSTDPVGEILESSKVDSTTELRSNSPPVAVAAAPTTATSTHNLRTPSSQLPSSEEKSVDEATFESLKGITVYDVWMLSFQRNGITDLSKIQKRWIIALEDRGLCNVDQFIHVGLPRTDKAFEQQIINQMKWPAKCSPSVRNHVRSMTWVDIEKAIKIQESQSAGRASGESQSQAISDPKISQDKVLGKLARHAIKEYRSQNALHPATRVMRERRRPVYRQTNVTGTSRVSSRVSKPGANPDVRPARVTKTRARANFTGPDSYSIVLSSDSGSDNESGSEEPQPKELPQRAGLRRKSQQADRIVETAEKYGKRKYTKRSKFWAERLERLDNMNKRADSESKSNVKNASCGKISSLKDSFASSSSSISNRHSSSEAENAPASPHSDDRDGSEDQQPSNSSKQRTKGTKDPNSGSSTDVLSFSAQAQIMKDIIVSSVASVVSEAIHHKSPGMIPSRSQESIHTCISREYAEDIMAEVQSTQRMVLQNKKMLEDIHYQMTQLLERDQENKKILEDTQYQVTQRSERDDEVTTDIRHLESSLSKLLEYCRS